MKTIVRGLFLLTAAVLLSGCMPYSVQPEGEENAKPCGADGDDVLMPSGREACVYRWPIVIETGFSCPAARTTQHDFPGYFAACTDFPVLRDPERDFLWDYYGTQMVEGWPVDESLPRTDAVDLLWVIDNSGSMCQEQTALRDNFDRFVTRLVERGVDFQIGVTTTHMQSDSALEPVAAPGALQSTPQPVAGFDPSCHHSVDDDGSLLDDYLPVREAIATAVDCMQNPDDYPAARVEGDSVTVTLTDAEIACAIDQAPDGCSIEALGCGGAQAACVPSDLYPDPSGYRAVPRVLRSADYRVPDGSFDVERLRADFACASLVGTRGYGVEQGLAAAVRAVSPEMLEGPNAGLVRDDARFGLFFVTDENDCSHDGTLDAETSCGADVCAFANAVDATDSPLLELGTLREQLLEHLSRAKGRSVSEHETYVASIHGKSRRFDGEVPTSDQCREPGYESVSPTCASQLGVAYSGDRYERFLLQFPEGNYFPDGGEGRVDSLMCSGDFGPAVESLGEFLSRAIDP